MDTFNQFWKDLEGMLDNLSQPVAFATAPLTRFGAQNSGDGRDNTALQIGLERSSQQSQHTTERQALSSLRVSVDPTSVFNGKGHPDPEEVMADEGQDLSHLCILFVSTLTHCQDSPYGEAFLMIPSATDPSLLSNLQKENETLRLELASIQQRLDLAERMRMEQEEQLRERIGHARREVIFIGSNRDIRLTSSQQAQRVKNSGLLPPRPVHSVDHSSLNVNFPSLTPMAHPAGSREQHLKCRVKELEEEVKTVRIENEKQVNQAKRKPVTAY